MNKIIVGVFASLLFAAPVVALADQTDVPAENGNPENVVSPWGLTNAQAPHVAPGETIMDAAGIAFTCPAFFSTYCVDITGTDLYKTAARATAQQTNGSGLYNYWLTH